MEKDYKHCDDVPYHIVNDRFFIHSLTHSLSTRLPASPVHVEADDDDKSIHDTASGRSRQLQQLRTRVAVPAELLRSRRLADRTDAVRAGALARWTATRRTRACSGAGARVVAAATGQRRGRRLRGAAEGTPALGAGTPGRRTLARGTLSSSCALRGSNAAAATHDGRRRGRVDCWFLLFRLRVGRRSVASRLFVVAGSSAFGHVDVGTAGGLRRAVIRRDLAANLHVALATVPPPAWLPSPPHGGVQVDQFDCRPAILEPGACPGDLETRLPSPPPSGCA